MFITYRTFNDPELANELAEHFKANGIEFETEDDSKIFDASFSFNEAARIITIRIRQEDLSRADELMNTVYLNQLSAVDSNYYIYKMTDDELREIIRKPDEWNPLDFELA